MCQSFLKKGNLLHKIGFFKTGVVGTVSMYVAVFENVEQTKFLKENST